MLQDAGAAVAMIVLAIVLEPLRSVTCWFMAKAREATDECKSPGVLDLLNPPYSCIVHARQYLASLLAGSSSRLILLWRHSGCNNVGEWYETCKDQVRLLRRSIMIADSSLFRRCERMYKRHHWWILREVDHRIPLATRLRQAEDFLRMRSCCLHIGFARKVHSLVSSAKELVETDLWTARLRFTARLLTMQCADIEWRHGRNRHKSNNHGKDSMTQMVARSICEEGKVIQERNNINT